MAPADSSHASAYGAQVSGIVLLATGLGWAFGWWWALVTLGIGLVLIGVGQERREPKAAAPSPGRRP